MSFLSGWQKRRIGLEGTIGGWDGFVTLEDVVDLEFVSDCGAEAAEGELGREADAAVEVVVTFVFVGVTEVELDVEVEVANEAVAKVVDEAETAVLEV